MFRSVIVAFCRAIKRGVSLKKYGLQVSRDIANVHNATVSLSLAQQQPKVAQITYKTFLFGHWLGSTSARLRCNPLYRNMANKRSASLYLAFIGFGYLGHNNNSDLKDSIKRDIQLDNWLQTALKQTIQAIPERFENCQGKKLEDYEINERLGKRSSSSAVYAAKSKSCDKKYAIKMLFNFAASSQSHSLKQAFSKELTVLSVGPTDISNVEGNSSLFKKLRPHHNVMKIYGSFADFVPKLPDADETYPAALPFRHNLNGFGRNRTLFLVMPRCGGTLSQYIAHHQGTSGLSSKASSALLTQLLEGVAHLVRNGVAHRDLKGDNLLVNETSSGLPHLVIADFDCCFAEKNFGLVMPFETAQTDKGGNSWSMAPEVFLAEPGKGHVIDYSKADEWAAALLAYEIFGQQTPFEQMSEKSTSKSNPFEEMKLTYDSYDLPEIQSAPRVVRKLVKQMLSRHPNDRPDINIAATVCQLLLWAPELCNRRRQANSDTVRWWLRGKTLEVAIDILQYKETSEISVENQILSTFLTRTSVHEILQALELMECLQDENSFPSQS